MPLLSRAVFGLIRFASRNGLAEARVSESVKEQARRTGIRGETYAYWYLRRHGYTMVARNYRTPETKGEIDLIGYDGSVLAFIEVKTRSGTEDRPGLPEEAVTPDKQRYVERMARRFLAERRAAGTSWRFDVVAIENGPRQSPVIRLHKGAFMAGS
ncbi:MAG TPA: YraN family protein [Candidatus Acidoferrales bacterium]|nr:YraN family protein [Candidatus Acidoferrales bacterium]